MKGMRNKIIQKLSRKGFEDHAYPVSRRDLLKLGVIGGVFGFFPWSRFDRAIAAMTNNTPLLTFDLAGGASLPGNFLVGMKGGSKDYCGNYKFHAWNPRESNSLDERFGLPMSRKASKILQGLLETLPQEISGDENQTLFKMASFCHKALIDGPENHSAIGNLVTKSGTHGRYLKNGVGQFATKSGAMRANSYTPDATFVPNVATSFREYMSLTSIGMDYDNLSAETKETIVDVLAQNAQLKSGYENLKLFGSEKPEMDPTRVPEVASIYGFQRARGDVELEAAIVYNSIVGNSGPGIITIPECDYHDSNPNTGDAKDLEIGQKIGRAVHVAHSLRKPVMIQILTDGGNVSIGSENYERIWKGDSIDNAMSVLGYYHPAGVRQIKTQVGFYNNEGTAHSNDLTKGENFFLGGPPEEAPGKAALAMFANYLNIHNRLGEFETLAARVGPGVLDDLLVFE